MECKINTVIIIGTQTFTFNHTFILNMDAERPSTEVKEEDSDSSHGEESGSESKWLSSDSDSDTSSDEQPETSRQRAVEVTHPCKFPGCKLVFRRPGRLKAHMNFHNGQRPFNCLEEGCSRSYFNSPHLKRHVKASHTNAPKQHTMEPLCSRCSIKKTSAKTGMKSEPKIPSKYVKENCAPSVGADICIKCKECFRIVPRKRKSDQPLTLCHVCGQRFMSARDFHRHERGHVTYRCPYIGCKNREFSFLEMRKHTALRHTGYFCNNCSKRFSSKAGVREHVAIHLNVREVYHCPLKDAGCTRKYFHLRNLTQHIETVHNKRRFPCEICSTEYTSKQKLTCHKTRVHSEEAMKTKPKRKPKKRGRKGPKLLKATMVHRMLGIRVIDEEVKKKKRGT